MYDQEPEDDDLPSNAPEQEQAEDGSEEADKKPGLTILDLIAMDNIADELSDDKLREIGAEVIRTYDRDKGTRAHRENKIEQAMNLALQIVKEKNFPWPKASNVIIPVITSATLDFASRAYPAIIDETGQVCKGVAKGDDSGLYRPVIAPIDGKPIPDPKNPQKPAMEMVVAPGAKLARAQRIANHISYQLTEDEDNWEDDTDQLLHMLPVVGCMFRKRYWDPVEKRSRSEIVFPQRLIVNYGCKSLKSAPAVSEEIELYHYEITERIRSGVFKKFEYQKSTSKSEPISDRERTDEATEVSADENAPCMFIQQLCRIDLDEDGYPEPYIVMVHKDTQTVCRIVANYEKDGILVNDEGEIYRINPETYYVKYGFIPAFDGGFYDLGFGELLLGLNLSVNTLINQLLDAGTLANAGGGFLGKGLRIKSGSMKIRVGEYQVVDATGARIADSVYQFQNQGPSLVLFQLLGFLIELSKDATGNKDVLGGEQMANQAGITAMQHIEQGLTKFKAIYKRLHRSIKQELKIQYRLNSLNLTDIQYEAFTDGIPVKVASDYRIGDADVVPVSDPNAITSMQKLAKAQALDGYKDDPYVNGLEARRRIFSAMGVEDQDKILQEPIQKTDPNAEALIAMAKAELSKAQTLTERAKTERMKMMLEDNLKRIKAALDTKKTQAEIAEIISRCIKNVADAEAVEKGVQIDAYTATVENITPAASAPAKAE